MPPTRTIPPAKAVKTERTHEENQERAYIAASRRSDRSLEARVESARRASEIHKRRTGRSLRVTEQDVINEEMYEEEDDDLPLHYRRLTAHLQTGSADFNRRLAAYLTNQVAMRSAMDQMINNSFAQQYPNAPQFAHSGTMGNFPSPMIDQNNFISSPTNSYRSAPYPSPHQPDFRNMHGRPKSIASPHELAPHGGTSPTNQQTLPDVRRVSMPASASPGVHSPLHTNVKPDLQHRHQAQSASTPHPSSSTFPPLWQDHSLFTTALPPESQQMLAPALDPNDPLTASLMAGSDNFLSSPHYPWGFQQDQKDIITSTPHPSFHGMSATLAPSALDANSESFTAAASGQSFDSGAAPSSGLDFNLSQDSSQLKGMATSGGNYLNREVSALDSGQVTPGESFWESYIQDDGWSADAAAS